jgi:hypothetical protein
MQPSCPGSRDLNWTGKGLKNPGTEGVLEKRKISLAATDIRYVLYKENVLLFLKKLTRIPIT